MNTSTLNKLPQAIADQSYKLLALEAQIREARELIAKFESEIDIAIAFGEYKNDSQRKVAKSQMMNENPELQDALKILQNLVSDRDRGAIEFDLLKHSFSVRKLEARERIAKLESCIG